MSHLLSFTYEGVIFADCECLTTSMLCLNRKLQVKEKGLLTVLGESNG